MEKISHPISKQFVILSTIVVSTVYKEEPRVVFSSCSVQKLLHPRTAQRHGYMTHASEKALDAMKIGMDNEEGKPEPLEQTPSSPDV